MVAIEGGAHTYQVTCKNHEGGNYNLVLTTKNEISEQDAKFAAMIAITESVMNEANPTDEGWELMPIQSTMEVRRV